MALSNIESLSFGLDSVVIRNYLAGIIGGKALDTTGYTEEYIKAGHLVIRDTKTDTYKPMPVTAGSYATLPEDHEYAGVTVATVKTAAPLVGIMYAGEVNENAVPYSVTTVKEAVKTALPQLVFAHD